MSTSVLHKIADQVKKRVDEDQASLSLEQLTQLEKDWDYSQSVNISQQLSFEGLNIIAEVKFKSPSEGRLFQGSDPQGVAGAYLASGAQALSILTERDFFDGKPEYLKQVRAAYPRATLLMKDFITTEYQIALGRSLGANNVLLIVALLGQRLPQYLEWCQKYHVEALVEVHDHDELKVALDSGANLVGVNNRDLKTLKISLQTSRDLIKRLPESKDRPVMVSESGLSRWEEIVELQKLGYQGFLMGSHFMKTGDPGSALKSLLSLEGSK